MIRIVLSTFPDEKTAADTVHALVSEKLAACGTLLPGARSIYQWEGNMTDICEVLVLLKISTTHEHVCIQRLLELHPYDVPEILSLAPTHAHENYVQWVLKNTSLAP